MKATMKRIALKSLIALRIYPHIRFAYSPFKWLEFEAVMEGLHWTGKERVLDIGCGAGLQTMLVARKADHTIGIDTSNPAIEQARVEARMVIDSFRTDFHCGELGVMHFPAEAFDRIFAICVLEHIPDEMAVLRECRHLLKPGGVLRLSVDALETIDPDLKNKHASDHKVCHYFTVVGLERRLRDAGFTNVLVRPIFCSEYARALFERGIRSGFNFGRWRTAALTKRLRRAEAHAKRDRGIFLVASANNPLPAAQKGGGSDE